MDEAQARIGEVTHSIRNRWRTQLSDATAELNALKEGSVALADRVRSAELRARSAAPCSAFSTTRPAVWWAPAMR